MRIAVIGAGTFGTYAAAVLAEQCPHAEIHVFEVGDKRCQSEAEIGYLSRGSSRYQGLSKGRYFGLGGTSNRWGGQVLTFSTCEFAEPSPFLSEIVQLNERYRADIARRLGIPLPAREVDLGNGLHSKEGVWLSYNRRNLYRTLRLDRMPAIKIRLGCRVTRLEARSNTVTALTIKQGQNLSVETFDFYVLASGAFESNRLLMISGLSEPRMSFSDHLSRRAFVLNGPRKFGALDFEFRLKRGCMLTRRLVGEVEGVSFFVHPIFNADFAFFQDLKGLLYRREFSRVSGLMSHAGDGMRFLAEALLRRRLYVHGPWFLQVDVEAPLETGWIELAEEGDIYGERGLNYEFSVSTAVDKTYEGAVAKTREVLSQNGGSFSEVDADFTQGKYEDTYHPFGMFGSQSGSLNEFYGLYSNLLIANTGILPRAGSINCTAAIFPVIEDCIKSRFTREIVIGRTTSQKGEQG